MFTVIVPKKNKQKALPFKKTDSVLKKNSPQKNINNSKKNPVPFKERDQESKKLSDTKSISPKSRGTEQKSVSRTPSISNNRDISNNIKEKLKVLKKPLTGGFLKGFKAYVFLDNIFSNFDKLEYVNSLLKKVNNPVPQEIFKFRNTLIEKFRFAAISSWEEYKDFSYTKDVFYGKIFPLEGVAPDYVEDYIFPKAQDFFSFIDVKVYEFEQIKKEFPKYLIKEFEWRITALTDIINYIREALHNPLIQSLHAELFIMMDNLENFRGYIGSIYNLVETEYKRLEKYQENLYRVHDDAIILIETIDSWIESQKKYSNTYFR